MHLVLVHDAHFFRQRLSRALAASWGARSFGPLQSLTDELAPRFVALADEFRLTASEQPLLRRCRDMRFSRSNWRHLAGELLLYSAVETPAFATSPELLEPFLPREFVGRLNRGSREVDFGGVPYRPEHAGLHDLEDLGELSAALAAIDPEKWSAERLGDVAPEEGEDELALARQCCCHWRELVLGALGHKRIVVCEAV